MPISEVDRVARELCDVSADSRLVKLARDVARAKLFLERIETFKARLMNDWLAKADDVENSESACELLSVAASADLKLLRGLARYERNAQAQWTKACKKFEEYRDTVRAASQ